MEKNALSPLYPIICIFLCISLSFPILFGAIEGLYTGDNSANSEGISVYSLIFVEGENANNHSVVFSDGNTQFSITDFPFTIGEKTDVNDTVILTNNESQDIGCKMTVDMFGDSQNYTTLRVYINETLVIDKENGKISEQKFTLYTRYNQIKFSVELDGTYTDVGDAVSFDLYIESVYSESDAIHYTFTRNGSCSGTAQ